MAKSELFRIPILGALLRFFKAFPVNRGSPDRQSIRYAVDLLKLGEVVCIFPEGQLSETGRLQPILPGAALIVRMANVQVICCGVQNTDRIMPYGKVLPRFSFRTVTATWGDAKRFSPEASNDVIIEWIEAEFRSLTEDFERPPQYDYRLGWLGPSAGTVSGSGVRGIAVSFAVQPGTGSHERV